MKPTKKDLMIERYWHNLFLNMRNLAVAFPIAYVVSSILVAVVGAFLEGIVAISVINLLTVGIIFCAAYALPLWWERRKEVDIKRDYLAKLSSEGRRYDRKTEAQSTWRSSFFWVENWTLYTICILVFFVSIPYFIVEAIVLDPLGNTLQIFLDMWLPIAITTVLLAVYGTVVNFVLWLAARKKWDEEQLYRG